MSQSRKGSLLEAAANIVVGIAINCGANYVLLPVILHVPPMTLKQNATLTAAFTAISLARSYGLRRLFNAIRSLNE